MGHQVCRCYLMFLYAYVTRKFARNMLFYVPTCTWLWLGLRQFKSPLAHTNEMAPDLGFYLSGRGPFVLEVLEKVLSADPEGS